MYGYPAGMGYAYPGCCAYNGFGYAWIIIIIFILFFLFIPYSTYGCCSGCGQKSCC